MSSAHSSERRVVITGLGIISPLGDTHEALWDALSSRRSGVTRLTAVPSDFLPTSVAGQIPQFTGHVDDFGPLETDQKKAIRKALKVMCRECQMGVAAAMRTLHDARLKFDSYDPDRAGIVYGSDYMLSSPEEFSDGIKLCTDAARQFIYDRWGDEGMRQLTPLWLLKYLPNMPACHIAIYNNFQGPNNSITHREAAANLAVGEAFRTIQRGSADLMVAGATGTRIHPMKVIHAAQTEELASPEVEPEQAARPFDFDRTGMVLGEGAGAVLLEELNSAQTRGARIYAEVVGTSSSSVSNRHSVAHRAAALANVMRGAMRDAQMSPDEIGHIHAHGLGTRTCDAEESQAIHEVFGPRAQRVPVAAAKSYFGNLGSGSGTVELVASVLSLVEGHLFPTLNYETPDPDCPVAVVRDNSTPAGESFLNLNVTPQGQASCVIVRHYAS